MDTALEKYKDSDTAQLDRVERILLMANYLIETFTEAGDSK